MAQTKIYPSTQAQVQAVQDTVDEINSKIVTPTYQVKTVMPSNVQQTVQADLDLGFTALSGVVVNPIAGLMPENLEDYIMRNDRMENFSISVNGSIPSYACYGQIHLAAVYGVLSGEIGISAFQGCASLQNIDIRNATSIGNGAFQGCTSLQNIDIRNATSIGGHAFGNCASLQNIDIRNATSIGNNTFYDCASLQNIDIRNATSIGNSAFQGCASLQNIDIRNATSIGGYAFGNCASLQLIDCTSRTTPPAIQATTFSNTNNSFRVVVATDTEKALFQASTNWSARASQIYTVAEIEAIVGMTYDEYYLQLFGHARNEVQA